MNKKQRANKLQDQILNRARAVAQNDSPPKGAESTGEGESNLFAPRMPKEGTLNDERADRIEEAASPERVAFFGPRTKDMAAFCRQLCALIGVGIPLLRSLRILAERTSHPRLRRTIARLALRVEEGGSLASALREHPRMFSHMFISVIEIGELGGILEQSIRRLAELLEKKVEMRRKIRAAMTYPAVALTACVAVVWLIVYYAVPTFQTIYSKLNADLPGATQAILNMSNWIRAWPHVYVPVGICLILLIGAVLKTRSGKIGLDWMALHAPVVAPMARKINVARFSRSLGALLTAGIPLLEALKVTARSSENTLIAKILMATHDSLEQGGPIETPLRSDAIIPPVVVDMVAIGYEAGALDDMFVRIADQYDMEVDDMFKSLSSIIEPVMVIGLGGVVAFMAAAILLPYFSLVDFI